MDKYSVLPNHCDMFFSFNLMSEISDLPSNPLVSPDWSSPVVCPSSSTSSCVRCPSTSLALLSLLHPSPLSSPRSPRSSLLPSPSVRLLSQMSGGGGGGQDWSFAGPSLRHRGGGACVAAHPYGVYESEESGQPLARRRKRRIQVKD